MSKIKNRFSVSADELDARMKKHQKEKVEPASKGVLVLEAAIDTVLKKMGVDVTRQDIPEQMDLLGIIMTEHTDERAPQLNGFFIYQRQKEDIIPYAWVGSARLEKDGRCFCSIHLFQDNRLIESGGIKIIQ